ncbi:MAG: 5-dehydro-2-deoxygluconokinase [Actinomycetota bacterium]|nr:5-dehydro-2-deoxygluconokinase [Actinomycetota bacterium]
MTAATDDVVVIGRVCIDLYPTDVDTHIEDVTAFTKSIGGSATNVAVAIARHGHSVALVTRTGHDPFGRYAKREMERLGINVSYVSPVAGLASVLTFCEMFPPADFPLYIYREPTAPDMRLEESDLPIDEIRSAKVLWTTATGLSQEPSRSAHLAALTARGRRAITILDLDYRPLFWSSIDQARRAVADALPLVTVAVGNIDECEMAVGHRDPHRAADALLDLGLELAVIKRGAEGVLAKSRTETVELDALPVDVVNGLGAGDGFGGALCHGLLLAWDLERTMQFANAAGAIVATRRECSTAMPTTIEVNEFLRR